MPKNKKPAKKEQKNDSNNKKWFKEFKNELKKIIWPSKRELLENSAVVISMVVIVAVIIFVLDLAFKSLNDVSVEAAKSIKGEVTVSSNEITESNETESTTTSEETQENAVELQVLDANQTEENNN